MFRKLKVFNLYPLFIIFIFFVHNNVLGSTIKVPEDIPSIQKAIDVAKDGDVILVAPGTYKVKLKFKGEKKTIQLGSLFLVTGDKKYIDQTVLQAKWVRSKWLKFGREYAIEVPSDCSPYSKIVGFTVKNGNDGISCKGKVKILNNIFINCKDGVDYEDKSGGICSSNIFKENRDDGIDLDHSVDVVIENNIIQDNEDDGIEIRLHPHKIPKKLKLNIVIRNNIISRNGEDGIQFIDYSTDSRRIFEIERNLFYNNAMAAIGCMGNRNTIENYEAFMLPERVYVINNTFVDNNYGLLGGKNMVVLNNIFVGTKKVAMKNISGSSVASYNNFWLNGSNFENSNIDKEHTFFKNPLLTSEFKLKDTSPCIDLGTSVFQFKDRVIRIPASSYIGSKPDLGAFESAIKK